MTEQEDLAATFAALGDPVRRAIIERLADGDATVNELAARFPISLQAVSKHIKVLESAGVVSRRKVAQTRPVHLEAAPLARSADWLEAHRRRLESRFERLDELLEQTKDST
jgi:DNA-binding transcriptional ArsR family regulator